MSNEYLEQLREQAGLGGSASILANEILVLCDQRSQGLLSREEYEFLMQDIALVKAQSQLADDEIACRFIIQSVQALLKFVPM
ncbi:hypothetical protein [Lake Baikal phage Baikal-20-5m-C28]|nr:hypothetical protein [Lake Baikal phage Baikal-20-5m-C28]